MASITNSTQLLLNRSRFSSLSRAASPNLAVDVGGLEIDITDGVSKPSKSFAEKFPALTLVTGFFFFTWYFLNIIFNKKVYYYFPYPYFVSVVHLLVGVVYCLVSWGVGLPKRAPIYEELLAAVTPVAFCHALGKSMGFRIRLHGCSCSQL